MSRKVTWTIHEIDNITPEYAQSPHAFEISLIVYKQKDEIKALINDERNSELDLTIGLATLNEVEEGVIYRSVNVWDYEEGYFITDVYKIVEESEEVKRGDFRQVIDSLDK